MFLIPSGVEQSDGTLSNLLFEAFNRLCVALQLSPITFLKLLPPGRLVAEPLSQFRAGGRLLQPQVYRGPLLAHRPRPESVDQNPKAVLPRGRFVYPL